MSERTSFSAENREMTIAEIAALSNRELGTCLAAVVFVLGFNIEAARITREAADRLIRLPSSNTGEKSCGK